MEIHGIDVQKIESLTEAEWAQLDEKTKQEYELILSYRSMFSDDFVDTKLDSGIWNSDFIAEFVFT